MPVDFPVDFLAAGAFVLSWGATYLVHSTFLLCGAWLSLRCKRSLGHSLREALWKTALVGGVITATAQMLLPPSGFPGKFTMTVDDFRLPGGARGTAGPGQPRRLPDQLNWISAEAAGEMPLADVRGDSFVPEGESWTVNRDAVAELAQWNDTATAGAEASQAIPLRRLERATADVPRSRSGQVPAVVFLAFVVFAGLVAVAWGISRCLWQTLSLRRKLGRCSPISAGPARRLLDELLVHVPRIPEVLLFADPTGPEPAAFGIRRWRILLPQRAAQELPEDELRALLAHELAHLVRGDAPWLCVSRIICSCLAFQPLNHLARREWQRAAEFLCDEWAVSRTGARLALARCLAEVAGWRLSGTASAALLAATGRKSSLADRIERLVASADVTETWKELRYRRWMLVGGVFGLALLAWGAPRVQLALGGSIGERDAELRGARVAGINLGDAVDAAQEVDSADAAKPQAAGESGLASGNAEATAVESAPAGSSSPAAHTESGDTPAGDLATLMGSLDRELSALESDLRDLEPLLQQRDVSPFVENLSERIRAEIVLLAKRRDALRAQWKKSAH